METQKDIFGMLDFISLPAFCVKNNQIIRVNQAAEGCLIFPGTDIRTLLHTGMEEYSNFASGCLYLMLNLSESCCGASVNRMDGFDVFVLDQESDDAHLRAFSLAALELRQPLLNAMLSAERISRDSENSDQLARLNRGLQQMHRILNNMSDAAYFDGLFHQETRDLDRDFAEIFEKAQALVEHSGLRLTYQGLNQETLALADRMKLERAILNMLSNAIKFTPKGGHIEATLSRHDNLLQLSIQDSGCGIPETVLPNVFTRYMRQPAIEDSRFGLGLGMVLIRSAAANHGGTVLIDQPEGRGTRVTMTMQLRQGQATTVRTPIALPGGQDSMLLELSDCLPASLYEK